MENKIRNLFAYIDKIVLLSNRKNKAIYTCVIPLFPLTLP